MERAFRNFGINTTSSDRASALERLGQRADRGSPSLSLLQKNNPSLSFHYTISEDRCGSNEDVARTILSRLGEWQASDVLEARRGTLESDASKIPARLGEGQPGDDLDAAPIEVASADGRFQPKKVLLTLGSSDRNKVTVACVQSLGYSARAENGARRRSISLTWHCSAGTRSWEGTFDLIQSAGDYEVLLNDATSEMLLRLRSGADDAF